MHVAFKSVFSTVFNLLAKYLPFFVENYVDSVEIIPVFICFGTVGAIMLHCQPVSQTPFLQALFALLGKAAQELALPPMLDL